MVEEEDDEEEAAGVRIACACCPHLKKLKIRYKNYIHILIFVYIISINEIPIFSIS